MRFSIHSLSFRVLILTIVVVMAAEVFIYAPSIGRFRAVYLEEKIDAARLAARAVTVAPDRKVGEEVAMQLLGHVGAHSITVIRDGMAMETLKLPGTPMADAAYDLHYHKFFPLIWDAFVTLSQTSNRVLEVRGPVKGDPGTVIEMTIDEYPMRMAMYDYSWRIFNLSLLISIFTAAMVFMALRWMMVSPLERITGFLMAFRDDPEDRSHDIADQGRRDEIGLAIRELSSMRDGTRAALRQKTRLAALGTAVNKISHDLRNMLTTATLISDRLSMIQDPDVQRVTPALVRAIDRAAALCSTTLNFSREIPELNKQRHRLDELVEEVAAAFPEGSEWPIALSCEGDAETDMLIDRDQMYRALANLVGNAAKAGATSLDIQAERTDIALTIRLSDNGPGIPDHARDKLFQPFLYSTNKGGTGLGLAIARDIVQAHGGRLLLEKTGESGSIFRIELPLGAL